MTQSVKPVPLRLFCAVELPDEARRAAFARLTRLRETLSAPARVSWEREEKLHVTLKFFGDVGAGKVEALTAALARAALSTGPLALRLEGAGVFPSPGRPNVLWIGVGDDGGGLARLHARVEEACAAEGFPPERRPFHPHVTLARVREANRETRRLAHTHVELGFEPSGFGVGEIVLMRSAPGPGGTVYTPLSRHELRGGAE
jgi:2'-5' RNA ligase